MQTSTSKMVSKSASSRLPKCDREMTDGKRYEEMCSNSQNYLQQQEFWLTCSATYTTTDKIFKKYLTFQKKTYNNAGDVTALKATNSNVQGALQRGVDSLRYQPIQVDRTTQQLNIRCTHSQSDSNRIMQ